jgi:hypothetical protein
MISRYALAVPVFGIFLVTLGGTSADDDGTDVNGDGDDPEPEDSETDTVRIEVIITDSSE